jgi:hypothetical protein
VQHATNKHELGQDQCLDQGETPDFVMNARFAQNRAFEQDDGTETYVEVGCKRSHGLEFFDELRTY